MSSYFFIKILCRFLSFLELQCLLMVLSHGQKLWLQIIINIS